MSNFKIHFYSGAIASVTVTATSSFLINNLEISILTGAACFIGSIAPDLDVSSVPSRWFARVGFAATILLWYFNKKDLGLVLGGSFFLVKSGKHRGFTHKYSLPLALIVASWFVPSMLWFGGAVGLIAHYALDRISPLKISGWV